MISYQPNFPFGVNIVEFSFLADAPAIQRPALLAPLISTHSRARVNLACPLPPVTSASRHHPRPRNTIHLLGDPTPPRPQGVARLSTGSTLLLPGSSVLSQ